MHWIDWTLVALPLVGLLALALYTRRFVRGVADFVSAGRCAGRYLLANAGGEAGSGVTNTVSHFEQIMVAGFIVLFWSKLSIPVALIVGITGFCVYRYRETRAMTVAQFFEMRYSRRFRLFMGCTAVVAGLLNYGIFPLVSARFFIYFMDLPQTVDALGLAIPTHVLFMAGYLAISCTLILFGGQVTLLVTDCVEGILSHAIYLVTVIVLFCIVSWGHILDVLTGDIPEQVTASLGAAMFIEPGHSPVNPFDAFKTADFNATFVLLGMIGSVYGVMSWQGGHGFRSAARTPHEGRMSKVLGEWRNYARQLLLVVLVICAMAFLRHPDFAPRSLPVKQEVAAMPASPGEPTGQAYADRLEQVGSQRWTEDKAQVPQIQRQQITSVTLRHLLPTGAMGLFFLVMILGLFAGDGNHLHSWSSILVQDVVLPIRQYVLESRGSPRAKEPMSPRQHLTLLRLSVVGVALFAFLFSWLVPLKVPIWMWWPITGAIYNAGAGAVIIGGLYWRKGTTSAAWTAMILGSSFAVTAMVLSYNWHPFIVSMGAQWVEKEIDGTIQIVYVAPTLLGLALPEKMWLNLQWYSFLALCLAASSYVVVSLLTCRRDFDMDWLLRRGKYRVAADHMGEYQSQRVPLIHRLIGIDRDFSPSDRFVAGFIFWWSMGMVGLNLALVAWHYGIGEIWPSVQMDNHAWAVFWLCFGLIIPFVFAAITLVWFSIGGVIDLSHFFRDLRTLQRDAHDDGSVLRREKPAPASDVMHAPAPGDPPPRP